MPNISLPKLFAIIFLEGFVTISLEILTIRQLVPFAGNSVVVTSLIIGIFLLFLAIGYKKGGEYQQDYLIILRRNFTNAAIMLGIGLSFLFTEIFFVLFIKLFSSNILFILVSFLLLVIAPIVYLLGQTIPITTNLFRQTKSIAAISGNALYFSTLGSFLGAILTSLLLLSFFGVAWSVFINFIILAILVFLLIDSWTQQLTQILALITGLCIVYLANIGVESLMFVHTDNYANYRVRQHIKLAKNKPPVRTFEVNNSMSSYLTADYKGANYIEFIKKTLFHDLQIKNKKILVVGAGGFSLSAESTFNNEFTYLDIDPAIYSVVKQHFINPINGQFIAQDARLFFKTTTNQYDIVVLDAYSNGNSIPYYLLTEEYFRDVRQKLNSDGMAVINMIGDPMLSNTYTKRVDNTISQVFHNCLKIPLAYSVKLANIVYICKLNTNENDTAIYTDNLNRATMDFFSAQL